MAYQISSPVYPVYTPVVPPVYYPVYSASAPVYTPIYTPEPYPVSSKYPTHAPECKPDIIELVEALPQSVQTIVFEVISESKYGVCDFTGICEDLKHHDVAGKVSKLCDKADYEAYLEFEKHVCGGGYKPVYPTSIPSYNVTSVPVYPPVYPTTVPVYPTKNGTTTVYSTSSTVIIVTKTDKHGKPTSYPVTVPVVPTPGPPAVNPPAVNPPAANPPAANPPAANPPAANPPAANPPAANPPAANPPAANPPAAAPPAGTTPSLPEYTGAAAQHVPEFGVMRGGLLAGAVGLVGYIFAEM